MIYLCLYLYYSQTFHGSELYITITPISSISLIPLEKAHIFVQVVQAQLIILRNIGGDSDRIYILAGIVHTPL